MCVCVRVCSRRLRQEWPRQGSSCNLRPQPMFNVQQCRGRSLASLRTTPLSRCCSRIPSSPPPSPLSTSTQCHHHTIAPNWPLHQYWSSAAVPGDRSISQTFPLAQPMVQWSAGLPLRWLPPPFSKLARYALQMRLFVGQSGTTLDRRGPPSGCCHSFPSGQFWLRETRVEGWWLKFNERLAPLWPGSGSGSGSPLRRLAIADLLNLMQPCNASGGWTDGRAWRERQPLGGVAVRASRHFAVADGQPRCCVTRGC